ncbi:signal recognition particle-docking protein FtsY [Niveispirillum irakense]|uniref:signal recognition particle-docking protein FtsY n=1 Tax=Niveispirillum irakense TaxID=34011 RepID=UPI00041F4B72
MLNWFKKKDPQPSPENDMRLRRPSPALEKAGDEPDITPDQVKEEPGEITIPIPVPVSPPPLPPAPPAAPVVPEPLVTPPAPPPPTPVVEPVKEEPAEVEIPVPVPAPSPEPAAPEPAEKPAEIEIPIPVFTAAPSAEAAALAEEPLPELEDKPERKSWFSRLKDGLSKSTARLTDGISGIFTKKKLDDEALEELEELLIRADLGPVTAARLAAGLAKTRFGKEVTAEEVKQYLAAEVQKIVQPVAQPLVIDTTKKPHVILLVGVNGTGKTTTIGKLARQFRAEGKNVWLAAGDTFRAAAVSQLQIWGERTGCPVISKPTGADAAGLAYEALEKATAAGADVLLIDTAGRLQNKAGLMEELRKIVRVIKKVQPDAPHTTLLTLDATTGQNAHSQVEVFKDMVSINGLILTKLDGSARGGVLVALAEKFKLPVHAIGVGEGVYDLRPFEADSFARALVGLE